MTRHSTLLDVFFCILVKSVFFATADPLLPISLPSVSISVAVTLPVTLPLTAASSSSSSSAATSSGTSASSSLSSSSSASAPLVSASASAGTGTTSCSAFVPKGWKAGYYKMYFYDNNPTDAPDQGPGFHAPTLPSNASNTPLNGNSALASLLTLGSLTAPLGTAYQMSACDIPTLNLYSNSTQSSCSHSGCYITYTDYIQITIPPLTSANLIQKLCLSYANATSTLSNLSFQPCLTALPVNAPATQYFLATQPVYYSQGFGSVTRYGDVDVQHIQPYGTGSFLAWALNRSDNKTVLVANADYTQVGLGAKMVMA